MARVALFAPSVLSGAASGYRLPTLRVALAFVEACGGDRVEWERRWRAAAGQSQPDPGVGGRRSAAPSRRLSAPLSWGTHPAGLSTVAPPSAEPGDGVPEVQVRPAQLPVGSSSLVGRNGELARARVLLAHHKEMRVPLVISGQVGVGKTAFALHLAYELSAGLPDGQLYADMGSGGPDGASPYEVMNGFLRALGVPRHQIPADRVQSTGLYRSLLAQRRVLVLLDDVCNERQVRPLLAQSPHSQILIASRARLLGLDGARHVELDVLEREESMAMIDILAGMEKVRAEPEVGLRLAELCDDLPLALSIVGKKLAAQPEWRVSYIADQLAERSRLLDRLRAGDVSIRGTLMSTYQRLDPWARRAFHHFGTDTASWVTPSRLAGSLWIATDSADHLLEILLDAGLLYRSAVAGRYGMLALFRLFAAGQPVSSWDRDLQPHLLADGYRYGIAPHFTETA